MEYRYLGRTGLRVSEIGFGAWAIGGDAWGPVEDADSLAAMERALELGINFVDTADVYGEGRSESLVAKAIRGRRDEVILSTKGGLMGHHRDPERGPVYDRPEKVVQACEPPASRDGPRGRVLLPHLVGRARGDRGVRRGLRPAQEGRQGARRGRLHQRFGPHRALRPG